MANTMTRTAEREALSESGSTRLRRALLANLPVTERHIAAAKIPTAVLEGGSGPPIVLLHGPAANATHWMRVIPALAAGRRVIAPDLPGHGESGAGVHFDVERMLVWLAALIEQTCTSPPVLVGQAAGGALAARFASRHAERIGALVLSDTFGLADFEPEPAFGRAIGEYFAAPGPQTHSGLWKFCALDFERLRGEMGEAWSPFEAYNIDRALARGANAGELIRYLAPAIPPAELERIAVPTLLVWGRHDRAIPLDLARSASARYGWRLSVIDGAADDPSVEQPVAFVRALRDFLGERS